MKKLKDTEPGTWHRLMENPDRPDEDGPTSFYVRWYRDSRDFILVDLWDNMGLCQPFPIVGEQRRCKYLDARVL
jgi:hypothetical protein